MPHLQSATYNELVARAFANYATGRSSLKSAMAAVMNAETERKVKLSAQFGNDDNERHNYFNSVMDLMFEQRSIMQVQSYNQFLDAPIKLVLLVKGMSFEGAAPIGVKLGKKIADKYYK